MKPGHVLALFLALAFSLATVTSLYAASGWVVIKDKNGVCKVIEAKEKTPATIDGGGPFKTKKEAEKAKDKLCPKGAGSTLDKIKEKAKQEAGKIKEKVKESVSSEKK
jgi:hypothetical protein